MHRPLALLLVLLVVGCGSKSATSPTGPATTNVIFNATLLPSNEVPPVSNADQFGSGTCKATLTVTKDNAGSITAATITFEVSLTGFPNNTSLNGAHIHQAPAGTNAGILIDSGLVSGTVVLSNGTGAFSRASINVPPTTAQGLIDNAAGYYFNVHTSTTPGGAARGQLVKQ